MIYGSFANGIGISEYDNSKFHTMVGVDVHSKPGALTCSYSLTDADTSGYVDSLLTSRVVVPAGDTFFGSPTNGKIYKVTTAGVVSLVHTNTNGAVLGMGFFDGYLYYASSTKLGRIAEGVASSEATWSSQADSWATFTNGDTAYKPMTVQNLKLFIGDGSYIAAVDDAGTFSANQLDLQPHHRVTTLFPYANDLVAGTIVGAYNNQSGLFRWDTYSTSWTTEDYVDEVGINCIIHSDDVEFISVGRIGNIYYYTGSEAKLWNRLADGRNTVTTSVGAYLSANLNGLPLLGNSRGVFSMGKVLGAGTTPIVIEYVPSAGQGTEIGAMATASTQLFVAWKNGSNYGIDKISANKYSGFVETPLFVGKTSSIDAKYDSLPTSTSIAISLSQDGGSYDAATVLKDDEDDRKYFVENLPTNKSTLQARYTLNANAGDSPVIRELEIKESE